MTQEKTYISVQNKDFEHAHEYTSMQKKASSDGAIVTFTGLVREATEQGNLHFMTLEHYPGMTEKVLMNICEQARARWPIGIIHIIHRVGKLRADEQIVFVGVSSKHRQAAFSANEFIMDFLKTNAPFWKKEVTHQGEFWVEAKASDEEKAKRWTS